MKKVSLKGKIVFLAALSILLASCGGGGGGGGGGGSGSNTPTPTPVPNTPITTPTPTPPVTVTPTPTPAADPNFDHTFASSDTIVGIIDNGFDKSLSVLNGRIAVDTSFSKEAYILSCGYAHGTIVAKTIAELNSDVKMYAINGGDSVGGITVDSGMYEKLYNNGVRIYNQSFGSGDNVAPTASDLDITGNALYKFYYDRSTSDSLFIWAAGNENTIGVGGASNPTGDALMPEAYDEMRRGWIVVTAVDDNDNIQSYANKIGQAANYGIAAKDQYVIKVDGAYTYTSQGTSFAAPTVTAAAAAVAKKFPWMNADLIRQSILTTANQAHTTTVTNGPNNTIGWGVLNATRALNGPARFDKRLTLASDNYNVVVDIDDDNDYTDEQMTFSNDISGDAGLTKKGEGILILSGNNTFTGDTSIKEGGLLVLKSHSSPITVDSGAGFFAYNVSSPVTTKNITNSGSVGVSGKGLKIDGNYIGSAGSSLIVDIYNSKITVTGTASFAPTAEIALVVSSEDLGIIPSSSITTRTLLEAGNITGLTAAKIVDDNINTYIDVSLPYDISPTQVKVSYKRNATAYVAAAAMAYVPASVENTGKNLDNAFDALSQDTSNSEFKAAAASIIATPAAALPRVWESLSGEIYASAQNLTFQQAKATNRDLSNRLVMISDEANKGGVGLWFNGIGADGQLYKKGYAKADTKMWGGQVGIDNYFTDNLILGAAVSASKAKADFNKYAGESDSTSFNVSAYGIYDFANSGLYALGRLGVGFVDTDVERNVYYGSVKYDHLKTSHDDTVYSGYAELGYKIDATDKFKVTPFVGLMHDSVRRGSFKEKDSTFGITSGSKTYDQTSGVFGVRVGADLGKVKFNAGVTQVCAFNDEDLSFNARYTGDTTKTRIKVKGISLPKNSTWINIGAEFKATEKLSVNLDYNMSVERSKVSNNVVSLGIRYKF